nr:hypothetical protein [Tanacetum cinerariifolium]
MAAFKVLEIQFQMFIKSRIYLDDEYAVMTRNYFLQYTQLAILEFHDTLIQHMESVKKSIDERAHHKREYDSRVDERHMQTIEEKVDTSKALDASLVDTKSSGTESIEQDTSRRSGNDAYITPIYDEERMAEVHTTAEINIFTTGQQYTEQPEFNNEGEEREYAVVKPHHVISSSESRNISKNMPRFSSNDMVHNHYLEEAKKKTQGSGRNSSPSVMPSARSQSTANGSKPKPRSNNQNIRNWLASKSSYITTKTVPLAEHPRNSRNFSNSKHFVCSTCQKCVFNANHDSCVTKLLTETSIVHEKTMAHRSCLRWKPMGKIFKTVGLRWVPTGKIFTSSTTKVDSEPTNGLNADITNQYECEQTLDVSAGTLNLSAGTSFNPKQEGLRVWLLKRLISQKSGLQFKAGSKSCSSSRQDSYITTRVGIIIPPSHNNDEVNM